MTPRPRIAQCLVDEARMAGEPGTLVTAWSVSIGRDPSRTRMGLRYLHALFYVHHQRPNPKVRCRRLKPTLTLRHGGHDILHAVY